MGFPKMTGPSISSGRGYAKLSGAGTSTAPAVRASTDVARERVAGVPGPVPNALLAAGLLLLPPPT
jgi:hypothetical protein